MNFQYFQLLYSFWVVQEWGAMIMFQEDDAAWKKSPKLQGLDDSKFNALKNPGVLKLKVSYQGSFNQVLFNEVVLST